jgi:site-specific recombinase XerD
MATLSDALTAYHISARAEGKSPKTIGWIDFSMRYFREFLGGDPDIAAITGDDLKRFIIALQDSCRLRKHPYARPQPQKLSPNTVETYARGVRAFFGQLFREGLIDTNPMQKVKMPRVPKKVVPTFNERELERLLAAPDKHTDTGFRDYTLLLIFIDTAARLSEIANLGVDDVDLEQGYLKVMGKGSKERYIPIGHKVARALLKYRMKHRPEPVGTDRFFLNRGGRPLDPGRIEKIVVECGRKANLKRCHPHKLRHSSSVMYLRNGGDVFSLQKKLGHSSLEMTRHYANLADSDVRAQHLRYGVADRLKG